MHDERPHPLSLLLAPAAVFMGLAAGLIVSLIVQSVGHAFGSPLNTPTAAVSLVSDYLFDLCFVGAALYMAVLRRSASGGRAMGSADFGYRRIRWRTGILAVVGAGVAYYGVSYVYSLLVTIKGTDKLPNELGVTHSTLAALFTAIFVCAFAPVCEEFFFRGFLFGVLRGIRLRVLGRDAGTLVAALIVAILFGLAHSGSAKPEYLVPLGLLGFVLCLVRWWTGSLYPCMAIHAINNAVALGVNEMHWGAAPIIGVAAASLAAIGLVTGPLSRPRAPRAPAPLAPDAASLS
ncbi:MAG TPA: type II CAAX endopeptidase family protein [Solirubrobacteraceae bacterium]|nr:type II CAAX endopeptidase family protein [Solirubrobacteraceae bacterium]